MPLSHQRWRSRALGLALALGGGLGLAALTTVGAIGAARATPTAALKKAGASLGEGAVEKIQPMLATTIRDVDVRLTRHEDRIGELARGLLRKGDVVVEQRLDQVNHLLEARLLQAELGTGRVVEEALGRVDRLVGDSLVKAERTTKGLTTHLRQELSSVLEQMNGLVRERSADLQKRVDESVSRADDALARRIEQLDDLAGRRLGNLDVIASKQRLSIEESAVRTAVLVGLVVFVIFVLRRLWGTYQQLTAKPATDDLVAPAVAEGAIASPAQPAPTRGALYLIKGLGGPLLLHLGAAGIAVAALFLLYRWLPLSARNEAAALARTHERQLEDNLSRFEFARAGYHASQLEYLVPDRGTSYQALAAKADLLRHLFARPTIWATDAGIAEVTSRLQAARRLQGRSPDPDLLVVEAMVVWHQGKLRRQEWQAASLCARALRLRPRGFALAPLARAYIETFLHAPHVDRAPELGRDAELLADLRTLLEIAPPEERDHPLGASLTLLRLMREADAAASDAYDEMVAAQAQLARLVRSGMAVAGEIEKARAARAEHARRVLQAWAAFDGALLDNAALGATPAVLAVFRLDDAYYTRAKWYVDHRASNEVAPTIAELGGEAALEQRLALAPPRVVWARRYRGLLDGPARELVELQEAERFRQREQAARDYELAMVADAGGWGPSKKDQPPRLEKAAANLGLYVTLPSGDRVPVLLKLRPDLQEATVLETLNTRGLRLL